MDIQELQVFEAPNIFSLRESIVKIQVKLGELADTPTKDIGNINEEIIRLFPGIKDHKCSTGYVGGFVDRLKEGTYLAHVTEHLCLETHRMLGYDMVYGKARQVKDDIYNVIFACPHPLIGKACAFFVINTLNDIIDGKKPALNHKLKELKQLCVKFDLGVSTGAIIEEARKRGIPVSIVNDGELIRLGYGKYQKCISATLFEGTSSIAVDSACNKQLTKLLLEEVSVPTPKGRVCIDDKEAVGIADEIGYPVVVKPKNGSKGKHVFINLNTKEEVKEAFLEAKSFDGQVIIEKYIQGKDYRLLVINGKMVAAAERIPAHVIGDGVRTIKELIDIENMNELRGEDHEKPLTRISVDDSLVKILQKQGLGLEDIPNMGQRVMLRQNANLSTGGIAVDCTDRVHPKNSQMAELAAKTIGLDIAGIDMVIPDITKPMEDSYGAIIEVNAAPGISMHLNPAKGAKRNVAKPILDMIFPKGSPFTIPIVAITGTNGKTTTTRMISRILRHYGYITGTTTTHGIYLNDKRIEDGDTTGRKSAKRILSHREVEAAVLETARGGIIRDGLAYEKADVAVFTNLTEDHLGIDGINTMEELLNVKALVVEAVKDSGASVLNADDPWVMKARNKAKGNLVLCSIDSNNPYILEHLKGGGYAVFKNADNICVSSKGQTLEVIKVNDIPATLNGALKHNIYNSMAAIGACFFLGIPIDAIRQTLREFSCDENVNPGRFNVHDFGDFKVVLDYGHNLDGYRVTIEGLRNLNPSRLVGIIGVPGDRRDDDIRNVGLVSGQSFDRIIIKEDEELRGRKPYEVANILLEGALQGGIPEENVEIIESEKEALKNAITSADKGDVIVVFFEKLEPLVQIIKEQISKDRFLDVIEEPLLV